MLAVQLVGVGAFALHRARVMKEGVNPPPSGGDFNAGGTSPLGGSVFEVFFAPPPDFNAGRGISTRFQKNDRKTAKIAPAARVYCLFYTYIGIYRP